MNTITEMLQRMRELAVQASNSTNTTGAGGDIDKLNDEYTELRAEVNRTLQAVQFNGQTLLSGVTTDYVFQVGANSGATQQITVSAASLNVGASTGNMSAVIGAGAASALYISAAGSNASAVLTAIDSAISTVNTARAKLGAVQSRFENTISFLRSASEQQAAARGRIMDADFAAETANLSRAQILQQAGTAMIAQANQVPQNVLSLLQG